MYVVFLMTVKPTSCLSEQDEESVPVELRSLPEYKELLQLKRLKKQKLQEIQEDKTEIRHIGYKVKTAP